MQTTSRPYPVNQTTIEKPELIETIHSLNTTEDLIEESTEKLTENRKEYNYKIKSGDTLSEIISQLGFVDELKYILALDKKVLREFTTLQSNKLLTLESSDRSLQRLIYHKSKIDRLILDKSENNKFTFSTETLKIDRYHSQASAKIKNSLYLAAKDVGISDKLIANMANILSWDIDFAYDVRENDYFTIVYEEEFLTGDKIDDGDIIALHFYNAGKHYHIFRYIDAKGNKDYYNANGTNIRKAFLRSPLDFAYISSHFNLKRKHPVLHKVRAHKGVDYAAKTGTPIRASGDGKIIWRATKGGYGKTVILKHGNTYTTLYAHMSRYAKSQRKGSFVKQGQIIGYVGTTGMSTGPHLHYEFRVNGVHKNPVKIKFPGAAPLAKSEVKKFNDTKKPLLTKLNLLNKAYLASLKNSE